MVVALGRQVHGLLLASQVGLLVAGGRIAESFLKIDCPIRSLGGWQCPGCGSTRCVTALADGDIAAGFRHNPLLAAAIGGSLVFSSLGVLWPPHAQRLLAALSTRRMALTALLLASIVVFTVIRNVV